MDEIRATGLGWLFIGLYMSYFFLGCESGLSQGYFRLKYVGDGEHGF